MVFYLELWHCGEDEHDDGGQEEEGADNHQHLGRYKVNIHWKTFPMFITFAAEEEFGSSNSFQMTFLSLAQHIPSKGLI